MKVKDHRQMMRSLTDPLNIPKLRALIETHPVLTQEEFRARQSYKPGGLVEPGVTHYGRLTEAEKRANVKTWEKNTGLNFEDVEKKKQFKIRAGDITGVGVGRKIEWTPEQTANYKKWIKLYSVEEYNKLSPDSQLHVRQGRPVKAIETRGKNLNNFFTQEIAKANAGEKFVSQKEILQKAYKKFNLKKINSATYPVLTTLDTRADKIDQTLRNMLMEDKPLNNFWQDAILKRTGLNNIILQRTLDSGKVKTYNVLADQGAAFIRQSIPLSRGVHDFIKNLSFSDQLSKALEIIEGKPILTGIDISGGRASAPKFKVMQFAFRSWNQNQGKGPIQFFDKNGKPITWEFGGKKLPVGEITFEYKGKKYNTKNLSDPSLVKKDFPEVYKAQIELNRFAAKKIDNPFKPGEKITVKELIKKIQVDGYKWSPRTGKLDVLHGPEGVKNKPFTNLIFNTRDINQAEQVLGRQLTSKKITKSQHDKAIKNLRGLFKGTTGLDYEQSIINRLKTQVKEIQKYKGEGKPLDIRKLLDNFWCGRKVAAEGGRISFKTGSGCPVEVRRRNFLALTNDVAKGRVTGEAAEQITKNAAKVVGKAGSKSALAAIFGIGGIGLDIAFEVGSIGTDMAMNNVSLKEAMQNNWLTGAFIKGTGQEEYHKGLYKKYSAAKPFGTAMDLLTRIEEEESVLDTMRQGSDRVTTSEEMLSAQKDKIADLYSFFDKLARKEGGRYLALEQGSPEQVAYERAKLEYDSGREATAPIKRTSQYGIEQMIKEGAQKRPVHTYGYEAPEKYGEFTKTELDNILKWSGSYGPYVNPQTFGYKGYEELADDLSRSLSFQEIAEAGGVSKMSQGGRASYLDGGIVSLLKK